MKDKAHKTAEAKKWEKFLADMKKYSVPEKAGGTDKNTDTDGAAQTDKNGKTYRIPEPAPYYTIETSREPFDKNILSRVSTVLIVGERGTGKELLSRCIAKEWLPKVADPLPVEARFNCAGWREELIRAELFGYAGGSFTGALKGGRPGIIEGHPVIFLDEIHRLPPTVQALLLRLLEYREFQPLGKLSQRLDKALKIVAAVQPQALDPDSTFLPDLRDRFEYTVELPSLAEDISLITPLFVISLFRTLRERDYSDDDIQRVGIPMSLLLHVLTNRWPGNIRQLNHYITRLRIFPKFSFQADLPPDIDIAHVRCMVSDVIRRAREQHPIPKDATHLTSNAVEKLAGAPAQEVEHQLALESEGLRAWKQLFTHKRFPFYHLSLLELWNLPPLPSSDYLDRYRASIRKREDLLQSSAPQERLRGPALHAEIKRRCKQDGNVSRVARKLGCSPKTVRRYR